MKLISGVVSLLVVSVTLIAPSQSQAQITGAIDGTNTAVNQAGNTFNITGGTIAGSNLFHSFQQFGLTQGQIANFLSNPALQNILARVTGGEASRINGQIQVTGGNANLYLMNPAGIIFGQSASLNVPGSFTATTANGIGFGNDHWFNAVGSNNYTSLLGTPHSFAFTVTQPGAIVNVGSLTVGQGQNLTLLGGTVVSTGTLTAPSGSITIASVAGGTLVRLTPQGSLLSLDLPVTGATVNPLPFNSVSLPQLLTGGSLGNASEVTVANGVVRLAGSGIAIADGDVVAIGITAGTATLSAANNLTVAAAGQPVALQTSADLNLLAGNIVSLRDRSTSPTVVQAGGSLTIQGDRAVDLHLLNHPASGLVSGGDMTIRSAGAIAGDAHYWTGGTLRFEQPDGSPGNVFSPHDPVILAAGDVTIGDYTGASLHILAGGSVRLGAVMIDNVDAAATAIAPAPAPSPFTAYSALTRADGSRLYINVIPTLAADGSIQRLPTNQNQLTIDGSQSPTLDVRAGINWAALGGLPGQNFFPNPFPPGTATTGPTLTTPPSSADITIASVSIANVFDAVNGGNRTNTVLLTNPYVPNLALPGGAIRVGGQSILLPTGEPDPKGITAAGIYLNNAPGVVVIDSRSSIITGNIIARPSSIDLRAVGNITTGDLAASSPSQTSQDSVVLVSKTGNIVVNTIDAGSNGIDVQAGGLFQAIAAVNNVLDAQEFFSINVLPQPGTDLRAFLNQKGITVDPNTSIPINFPQQPIVSIIARPQSPLQTGKPAGSLNAPITITYSGGTRLILD